jgi:hypothetical protein
MPAPGRARSGVLLSSLVALSLVAIPVMTLADASAPGIDKVYKKKPKAKPRMRKRAAVAKPAYVAPPQVETVQAPPVVEAPPVPEAPPAPAVAEAPPPPEAPATPAPPVETLKVSKKGNGTLLALLAAAGVIGGIVVAADTSTSP